MIRRSPNLWAKGRGVSTLSSPTSEGLARHLDDANNGHSSPFQQHHKPNNTAPQPTPTIRLHDLFSYNKRPHNVHNGRLSGDATTLVHPSARREASRHVVHEDDLLPSTQSDRLFKTLAKYGSSLSPSQEDRNALFSQFVLIRRCYPSSSHVGAFPSQMGSTSLVTGGMLVGQPALERGPASTPHYAPPHTSFDVFRRADVIQQLYAMLNTFHRCMSSPTSTNNNTLAIVHTYTLLHELYTSLLSPSQTSGGGGVGGDNTHNTSSTSIASGLSDEGDMSCAISATHELSRVLHSAVRSGGDGGGSFWGKLHPCTHHVPNPIIKMNACCSLFRKGLVMALDTYLSSTSPPPTPPLPVSAGFHHHHTIQPPSPHTSSATTTTVGVVVMTDVEFTFFVVDSMTGALLRPPTQVLYEKGALTRQFGNSSLFHGNEDYKAFIQTFWVDTLSSSLEFQMASRWVYRFDPQAWNVLRQLSEDGSLSNAWDVLSSSSLSASSLPSPHTFNPPPSLHNGYDITDHYTATTTVIDTSVGDMRHPRTPLNIISERRLHQREVHSQRTRDREVDQQLLHESLFTASTTQPSLFSPSLLPPTRHLTLQSLSPRAINPYKATHGSKKRERERLLDEIDGDSSSAPRNGRFRAALESANSQVSNTEMCSSSTPPISFCSQQFPFKDFAVVPVVDPRWVALPRTYLMSNANWNTSPTMMAQEMKYGLFQLCNPYA